MVNFWSVRNASKNIMKMILRHYINEKTTGDLTNLGPTHFKTVPSENSCC